MFIFPQSSLQTVLHKYEALEKEKTSDYLIGEKP